MKMIEDVEVPEGWRRVRLGEIGKIISGSTPNTSRPDLWNGDIVWVTPDDLSRLGGKHIETSARKISSKGLKNCSARLIPHNSIVISSRAPIGYLAISKNTFTTNQGCKSISLYQNYNSDFIYYCLHLYTGGMLTLSSGTTFNEISKTGLEKLKIIVPSSLSEQCKIAEILETVDNAIERTNTIIEKYKRIKQGLMQDLLTRGVVENDELGVMNYELRNEKKHGFKDSPLGRIPEEWEVVELMNGIGGNANLIVAGPFGSNLKVQDYKKTGIPIIRLQNIDENKFIDKDIKFISDKKAEELSYHSFKSGDLILAKLGDPIGKTCIVPNNFKYGIVVADVVRIRANEQYADKRFISYILNFDICRNQLNTDIIGTTRPRVNLDQIRNVKIPLPQLSEQHIIASILSQTDETIEKEQKYKQKLERIKQGLMEDLLTGKVRVNHLIKEGMKNVQQA
jgi:type I restriction enzyme S subunit